ncbi:MAG: hypothetical protein QF785_03360 [Phycisphaeraceae bacterium]|jgi:hypothetical protein|nr:hypothetical protein [Phycisphaeraceae bacterium]MDP7347030.1 hypothetical protein [Phycisphaeraceae bacterium]
MTNTLALLAMIGIPELVVLALMALGILAVSMLLLRVFKNTNKITRDTRPPSRADSP